jgi:hypothetical protein
MGPDILGFHHKAAERGLGVFEGLSSSIGGLPEDELDL